MGYKLEGPTLELKNQRDLLSEAVSNGSIQVPPDGNPIILLADRQTNRGYPKIAQVITADLSFIAQMKPGECIKFSQVTLQEAEQLYLQKEQQLHITSKDFYFISPTAFFKVIEKYKVFRFY